MKVTLCALDDELHYAWEHAFSDVEDVCSVRGDILSQSADAIVSPANSFGYMDGGLDLIYSQFFGWELEKRLRNCLLEQHHGELPVGQAVIVPTEHDQFRWLISAPTMRVPARVPDTTNAMLAFRATLLAVAEHNLQRPDATIQTVACPGLGTGEGRMPPNRCARQMRYAWDVVRGGALLRKGGLAGAVRNHLFLLERESEA